jgi:hypothetical protein
MTDATHRNALVAQVVQKLRKYLCAPRAIQDLVSVEVTDPSWPSVIEIAHRLCRDADRGFELPRCDVRADGAFVGTVLVGSVL